MSVELPPCPPSLKQIQHFLKTAQEHDGRDIVVSYWARLYALQVGLKVSTQAPEETKLLIAMMDWLETVKKEHSSNEAISNEVAAQAHLDNYALKLFLYADKQDREANFGKNVVKAFYTAGVIYDILQTFGELSEEAAQNRKYAKFKAAYIHTCLKNGETPIPGPPQEEGAEEEGEDQPEEEGAAGGEGAEEEPPADLSPEGPAPAAPTVQEILDNPDKLPSPPAEPEKPPGGFVPFVPSAQPTYYIPPATEVHLSAEQVNKAQKYCKYASSALDYDDLTTAIENLQRALRLIQTGSDE